MLDIHRCNSISPVNFLNQYLAANRPVLLSGLANDSGAMRNWGFDFFTQKYGARSVEALNRFGNRQQLSMASLIESIRRSDDSMLYLRSLKIVALDRELLNDVPVLPHFSFDLFQSSNATKDFLKEIFIGAAGSGTPLHVDLWLSHSWMLLVAGVKEWIIVSPTVSKQVNLEQKVRLKVFTENITHSLQGVEYHRFLQRPGEIVYIPSGWWHSVTNIQDSIGVSYNFMDAFSLPGGYASTQGRGSMFDELLADHTHMLLSACAESETSLTAYRLRDEYIAFLDERLAQIERKRLELTSVRENLMSVYC